MTVVISETAQVRAVLRDATMPVVSCGGPPDGIAWLRAHVARFCDGPDHDRRRALVETELARLTPARLRHRARAAADEPLAHVRVLAEALGFQPVSVSAVAMVAAHYQRHESDDPEADRAVAELVAADGGIADERTAARISLLIQACQATGALVESSLRRRAEFAPRHAVTALPNRALPNRALPNRAEPAVHDSADTAPAKDAVCAAEPSPHAPADRADSQDGAAVSGPGHPPAKVDSNDSPDSDTTSGPGHQPTKVDSNDSPDSDTTSGPGHQPTKADSNDSPDSDTTSGPGHQPTTVDSGGPAIDPTADELVARTIFEDPPVRRTRRIVDGALVEVDLARAGLVFGAGPHRCPGREHALALAAGLIEGAR